MGLELTKNRHLDVSTALENFRVSVQADKHLFRVGQSAKDDFDFQQHKNYFDDFDYHQDNHNNSYDSPYYNDNLDMDQQSPEFWDSV